MWTAISRANGTNSGGSVMLKLSGARTLLLGLLLVSARASAEVKSVITFPGGSNESVQTNKRGSFYGDGNFTYSTATHRLTVPQVNVSTLNINGITYTFPRATPGGGTFWMNDGSGGI